MVQVKGLLRHIAENFGELQIHGRRSVGLVVENDVTVAGDLSDERHGHALPQAELFKEGALLRRRRSAFCSWYSAPHISSAESVSSPT